MAAEVTLAVVVTSVAPLPRVANITLNVSITADGIASANLSGDRSVLTLESASVYS